MPLCTRLDGRSKANRVLVVKDDEGKVVARVEAVGRSAELSITTELGHTIEKLRNTDEGS